jgi:maltose O-acetyltransferase
MRTEREKMLAGEPFNAMDAELVEARKRARRLCHQMNTADPDDGELRASIIRELFGKTEEYAIVQPPFHCDYGSNIYLGRLVFFNFNCVVLDSAEIRIGDNVFIGPATQIYGATHPLDPAKRLELDIGTSGRPVTIGSGVWIGGGSIICPGVTIGDGCTIGAGSVVTRDIPPNSLAAGNPCRVIRTLDHATERPPFSAQP